MLEKLGRDEGADADRKKAECLTCPPGSGRRLDVARYETEFYSRLDALTAREDWNSALEYIDDTIRNRRDGRQAERDELVGGLMGRAEAFEGLGETQKAKADRLRAEALTKGIERSAAAESDKVKPQSYEDIVREDGE